MNLIECKILLAEQLSLFRAWTYDELVAEVERTRREHECLEIVEGKLSSGEAFQIEFNVEWDDVPGRDVRVLGALTVVTPDPSWLERLLDVPDATDSFIMSSDGTFAGE